ncbi:MAG: hypothetical protein HPY79_10455 [Bacteroidales bacterium]|nr:hypothetical protein [Bacteroidales bacterium]
MGKYLITNDKGLKLEVAYDESGVLYALEFHCDVTYDRVRRLLQVNDIITYDNMLLLTSHFKMKVAEIAEDLSFDRFWNVYSYKVGNKTKTEKLWNALSDADKTTCLRRIKAYKSYLERTGIAQAYPETYLRNRRWEDQY